MQLLASPAPPYPLPSWRAMLVEFEPKLRDQLAAMFLPYFDSGVELFILVRDKTELASASQIASSVKRSASTRFKTLDATDPELVAQACADIPDTPPPNTALRIKWPPRSGHDSSDESLVRRAFSDFDSVKLSSLSGGFAALGVWKAEATRSDGNYCVPFVVKSGDDDEIEAEINVNRDHVLEHVPFPNHPPVREDRCVRGATKRLIVSMLVDRAVRFDEYIRDNSSVRVISALFDGPLRNWRANSRVEPVAVGKSMLARYVRDITSLDAAADLAARKKKVALPAEFNAYFDSDVRSWVAICQGHGDLHPRNIFVRREVPDTVLIDFGKSGTESPSVQDPACLDVHLALDRIKGLRDIPSKMLQSLFRFPLIPVLGSRNEDNRLEAIRHIRMHAMSDGSTELTYGIGLIVFLLRYAKLGPMSTRRAMAYTLASDLLKDLQK